MILLILVYMVNPFLLLYCLDAHSVQHRFHCSTLPDPKKHLGMKPFFLAAQSPFLISICLSLFQTDPKVPLLPESDHKKSFTFYPNPSHILPTRHLTLQPSLLINSWCLSQSVYRYWIHLSMLSMLLEALVLLCLSILFTRINFWRTRTPV